MKQAERIGWIDTLRAFAVFAIVLGHTLRNATVVYPWLYSFHVPLCVLTSGIVFHVGQKKFGTFLKRKIQSTHDSVLLLLHSSALLFMQYLAAKWKKLSGGGTTYPLCRA